MEIKTLRDLVRKFGEYKLRSGDEIGFDCPKCGPGRKKFHLGVNLKKKVYHCFKCSFSGGFGEGTVKIEKPKFINKEIKARLENFRVLSKSDKRIKKYLRHRGILTSRARVLRWGTCERGTYRGRLVIPITEDSSVVFFVARATNGEVPKELSPKKDQGWMQRSEVVYGLDQITDRVCNHIVVVEGIFDAEYLNGLGYTAVSILGSHISEVQIGKILSKKPERITLMFDGDDAGYKGAAHAYHHVGRRFRGEITRAVLAENQDPDNMTKEQLERILK